MDFVTGVRDAAQFDSRVRLHAIPPLDVPIQSRQLIRYIGESVGAALVNSEVRNSLARHTYDIVHGNTCPAFTFSRRLATKSGCKTVFTVHNTTPVTGSGPARLRGGVRRVTYRILDQPTLCGVDHLVALSKSTADEIQREYGLIDSRVSVIPTGVDVDVFRPDVSGDEVLERYGIARGFVLAVGRLVSQKGFSDFVRSLCGTQLHGVLVGDGPDFLMLKGLSDRLLRPGQLTILRAVPHEHLPPIYASATAYAFTSVAEGLPAVGVEALSSGLPIVAMRAPGVTDLVAPERNGVLVPPGNSRALGEALQRVATDHRLRSTMSSASRSLAVEHYSWGSVAAQTFNLYRELLDPSPSL